MTNKILRYACIVYIDWLTCPQQWYPSGSGSSLHSILYGTETEYKNTQEYSSHNVSSLHNSLGGGSLSPLDQNWKLNHPLVFKHTYNNTLLQSPDTIQKTHWVTYQPGHPRPWRPAIWPPAGSSSSYWGGGLTQSSGAVSQGRSAHRGDRETDSIQ